MTSIDLANTKAVTHSTLKREILGIGLLLFAVFLLGAFIALGLAQLRAGVSVHDSVGFVGTFLANPLVKFFGWPAAFLIPLVPAVHALRLFGRLESSTDRSWMIFFAGLVVLLPIFLALALPQPAAGTTSDGAGIWGAFVVFYGSALFGSFGAWIMLVLAMSVLMAATLAWNPIRALVGRRPDRAGALVVGDEIIASDEPGAKRRRKREKVETPSDANLALALEPPPEEMPAIDPSLVTDADLLALDAEPLDRKRSRKKSKAEVAAASTGRRPTSARIGFQASVAAMSTDIASTSMIQAPKEPNSADA
jgi:hypothetical protein